MSDRIWTTDDVADQLEEAARTLRKLPPARMPGYFNTWPDYFYEFSDLVGQEPQPMRLSPSPAAISRLEQTFDWMPWLEEAERKLVWARAARVPWIGSAVIAPPPGAAGLARW